MLLKAIYWGGRAFTAMARRVGMVWATALHRAVLGSVGQGTRFQTGVRFANPEEVAIGAGCYFWGGCNASADGETARLIIGDRVQINRDVHLDTTGGLTIGSGTLISEGAVIYTHDHGLDPRSAPQPMPKLIGPDVWIGMRAVILPQCRQIGAGAVIGAGAIVVRDVPAGAVVAGNPAQIIRQQGCERDAA